MGEVVSDAFEQFLQVALGDPLGLGHARGRKLGVVQRALDGLADPVQDRCLRRGVIVVGVRRRHRAALRQGREQFDEVLRDRCPLDIGQDFEGTCGCLQRPGKHVGEADWRNDLRLAKPGLAEDPAVQGI